MQAVQASEAQSRRRHEVRNTQPLSAASVPGALLNIRTVAAVTSLGESTIWRRAAAGDFPAPTNIGPRCTRWRASDVSEWIDRQVGRK